MNKIKIILWCLAALIFQSAKAEVASTLMAAKVQSFDEKSVRCEIMGKKYSVPKNSIVQSRYLAGDAVLVRMNQNQFAQFLAKVSR